MGKCTYIIFLMQENRFSILGKDISNEIDVYELPSPPKNGLNTPPPEGATSALLNVSAGTTVSTATTPSPSNTPKQHRERDSVAGLSTKKKSHHKNENNNQVKSAHWTKPVILFIKKIIIK